MKKLALSKWICLFFVMAGFNTSVSAQNRFRVPEWMVGHFEGVNKKYQMDVEFKISRNGVVTSSAVNRNSGKREEDTGVIRNGKLVMGKQTFYVDQQRDGIKISQVNDRSNTAYYRHVDRRQGFRPGMSPSSGPADLHPRWTERVPQWLVGTYSGYNRKYGMDVIFTISRDGNVDSDATNSRTGKVTHDTGTIRDGKLFMGKETFYIDQAGNSIRFTQTNDSSNTAEYRRR